MVDCANSRLYYSTVVDVVLRRTDIVHAMRLYGDDSEWTIPLIQNVNLIKVPCNSTVTTPFLDIRSMIGYLHVGFQSIQS